MNTKIALFLVLLLFASCEGNSYHQIKGGEFTVNYSDQGITEQATELAKYWKENDLIVEGKQDIALFFNDGIWIVKLIANDPKEELTFEERKLFIELENDLSERVFNGNPVSIQISNKKFETIYEIS